MANFAGKEVSINKSVLNTPASVGPDGKIVPLRDVLVSHKPELAEVLAYEGGTIPREPYPLAHQLTARQREQVFGESVRPPSLSSRSPEGYLVGQVKGWYMYLSGSARRRAIQTRQTNMSHLEGVCLSGKPRVVEDNLGSLNINVRREGFEPS